METRLSSGCAATALRPSAVPSTTLKGAAPLRQRLWWESKASPSTGVENLHQHPENLSTPNAPMSSALLQHWFDLYS